MMKRIIFVLLTLLMVPVFAREITSLKWCSTYEEAQVQAQKQGFPILLYFSGSDWVSECLRIEQEIFTNRDFIRYVKANFILYKADFPRMNPPAEKIRRKNEELIRLYRIEGFPAIVVVSASGKLLRSIQCGYNDAPSLTEQLSKARKQYRK